MNFRIVIDALTKIVYDIVNFIPNLVNALVILIVGYLIAKAVAKLASRGLSAAGADRAVATGTAGEYRDRFAPGLRPSSVIGRIVFWFVFGLTILLAVSALGVDALTDAISAIVGYLPNVVAALLILLVAIAIAGAVGGLAQRLLGGTMLGRLVQTVVPVLVITIALFMALVQLQIAIQIVVATYVIVLGSIGLGFALAFGLGGRNVADRMLTNAYETSRERMPQVREEARLAKERAVVEAETLKEKAETRSPDSPTGARSRPEI